jgi:hypothetical protein
MAVTISVRARERADDAEPRKGRTALFKFLNITSLLEDGTAGSLKGIGAPFAGAAGGGVPDQRKQIIAGATVIR